MVDNHHETTASDAIHKNGAVRPKIAHLSSVHPPFDTRIFEKQCRTLAVAGYEVVLVVPHTQDEVRDSVQIRAVPLPSNRRERLTRTVWQVYRAAVRVNAAVYHFHDPELMLVGILLKLRGKRVIYDVHETYRMTMTSKHWLPWIVRSGARLGVVLAEAVTALVCDRVVTANPGTAQFFPPDKTLTIHNYNNPELIGFGAEREAGEDRTENREAGLVVYVGGMWVERGIVTMVDAIAKVPAALKPRLVLAGSFDPPSLEEELSKRVGWERVSALGWRTRSEIARLLQQAQVGLSLFHPMPNHVVSYPNKIFEYMASGVPIIASNFPLLQDMVGGSQCGLLVDPLDPDAIAEAITWMLQHPDEAAAMGANGKRAVAERYNWDCEGQRLIATYAQLAPLS